MVGNNNKIIEEVYKNHRTWLFKVAYNFTQSDEGARELLQELFLYLLEMPNIEKIKYGNSVNLFYLYKILKTRHLSNISPKKSFILLEEDWDDCSDEYDYASDTEFERRLTIVTKEMGENGELDWFTKQLFRVYHYEDHSLTSLSKATSISRSACYNSIKKFKKHIKSKV
jgi:DNA-directed RNA polymerase specialized sigma24 family protein